MRIIYKCIYIIAIVFVTFIVLYYWNVNGIKYLGVIFIVLFHFTNHFVPKSYTLKQQRMFSYGKVCCSLKKLEAFWFSSVNRSFNTQKQTIKKYFVVNKAPSILLMALRPLPTQFTIRIFYLFIIRQSTQNSAV